MDLETINQYLNLPNENIVFVNKEKILSEIREVIIDKYDRKFGFVHPETVPVLNYNLSYFLLRNMARSEIEKKTFSPPTKKPVSERERFIQKTIAHYKSQIRARVLLGFLIAESENRSLIGNANKTEWLIGLFTKFGTYHAADFLPLACLYRSQVIQLANHLGLQEFLTSKISQSPSSYEFFFNLPVEEVDRMLIRLESGFSVQEVFMDTNIPLESVKKVDNYYQTSIYSRTVPLIPEI